MPDPYIRRPRAASPVLGAPLRFPDRPISSPVDCFVPRLSPVEDAPLLSPVFQSFLTLLSGQSLSIW